MAVFRLKTASETRTGTNNADTFDGYKLDDGLGETGGTDTLSGRGGDDLFLLDSNYSLVSGLIDGGNDTDTVRAYGFDLGSLTFQNVEILSIESPEFGASIAQLNAFSTITSSLLSRIKVYLVGPGGTIDVSGRMAPGKAIEFNALGLSAGYDATGTDLNDVFKNSYFNDVVHGGLGADAFWGVYQDGYSGGTDQLYGDGGNDIFHLRRQSGTINGGAGQDTVVAHQSETGFGSRLGDLGDATFFNVEKLSSGPNVTFATIAQLNSFATITGGNADKLILFDVKAGAGGVIDFSTRLKLADERIWLRAYGATSAVEVTGTARDDVLTGSAYNDTLSGGDGNDYLGGAEFAGGPYGTDTLIGGAGSDNYYVNATDNLVELVGPAGGIDTIFSTGSYDLGNTARLQGDFENLTLSGYLGTENPNTSGYGNALDNLITGNGGNNYLDGRSGADHLVGRAGNDRLNGGAGNDTLVGGTGRDLFLFDSALDAATNVDTIFDFSTIDDKARLENSIFTAVGASGTLAASAFFVGAVAHDSDDRIIYDSATGALRYDSDGNNAGAAIQFATLSPALSLGNTHFQVV
jgi:serralysin